MRVIIVYHTITKYDAIGADIVQEYLCLKKHGHDVYIYAEKYDNEYRELVVDENAFLSMTNSQGAVVIFHHGGYWHRGSSLIGAVSSDIYLRYHNVTPPEFFKEYNPDFYDYALRGRKQTQEFVESGKISWYITNSHYTASELKQYGVRDEQLAVVPPFHKLSEFEKINPDVNVLQRLLDGKINFLFVGRVAPNKGHKHLIRTVEKFVHYYGYDVRVNIVGGTDPKLAIYYDELKDLISGAGLNDNIFFRNHVSSSELFSYYIGSHVFMLLSEHEGFCVPVLEAQYHHLPIIALNRGAVKETMGDEQLVFDDVDYDVLASAAHVVCDSQSVRSYLAAKGRENYNNYSMPNLEKKFIDSIHG